VQTFTYPADSGFYHLDRVDQHALPLDATYNYDYTGAGVHIYIVDSGIRGGHQEWGYGRIGASAAFIKWSVNPSPTIDQLDHGTAVASMAAGTTLGVAKNATLHSVRIDDGQQPAYESDMLAGIDWVAGHRILPAVLNLSYDNYGAVANTVSGLKAHGITLITAAGNDHGADACNQTTQISGVITVGATNRSDERTVYSDQGTCVDLFAPGGETAGFERGYGLLKVASSASNSAFIYNGGTSLSSPVVAGVAALILQQNSHLSPDALEYLLQNTATQSVVTNVDGVTTRRLAYSRPSVPPPPSQPSISISGPNSIGSPGEYTWYGEVSGTTESYTVTWDKSLDEGETWSAVGTGDSYSIYEGSGSPHNIIFRATLLTQDEVASSIDYWVYVDTSCGGNIC
jgi:subtilisin family serine protease